MSILRAEVFIPGESTHPEPKIRAEEYLETAIQLEQLGTFSNLTDEEKTAALNRAYQVLEMAAIKEQMEIYNCRFTTND